MAQKPKEGEEGIRRTFRDFVRKWVRENLTQVDENYDYSVENWLSKTSYPEHRKQFLKSLHYKMLDEGKQNEINSRTGLHKIGSVNLFIKDEFYEDYKYPRGIWTRTDEFKTVIGPYFKAMEEQVYKCKYFIKQVPVRDRSKYIYDQVYRPGYLYQESDYTTFECHFDEKMMLDCEYELYSYMLSRNPVAKSEFDYWFNEVICAPSHVKNKYMEISMQCRRFSGEMNTSLGNGFFNLMILLFACSYYKIDFGGVVVEGDDGLISLSREIPPEYYKKMGLNVKLKTTDKLNEAGFCGLYFDEEECINLTDPREYICTLPWVGKQYITANDVVLKGLIKCKAMSLLWQYQGCPILDVYAKRLLILVGEVPEYIKKMDWYNQYKYNQAKKGLETQTMEAPITLKSRLFVEKHFNIPIEKQLLIEQDMEQMTLTNWDTKQVEEIMPLRWGVNYLNLVKNYTCVDQTQLGYPVLPFGKNCFKLDQTVKKIKKIQLYESMYRKNNNRTNTYGTGIMSKSRFQKLYPGKGLEARYQRYLTVQRAKRAKIINKKQKMQPVRQYPREEPGWVSSPNWTPTADSRTRVMTKIALSDCALNYAIAMSNPFAKLQEPACIPDTNCVPSYKFSTRCLGTMVVGTGGTGVVACNPWTAMISDNGHNTTVYDYPIIASAATYGSANVVTAAGAVDAGYLTGYNSNSAFYNAFFEKGVARLVGAGVRVWYAGKIVDQQGVATMFLTDGLRNLDDDIPVSVIQNNPRAKICTVSKDSNCYVTYTPTSSMNFSYLPTQELRPSTSGQQQTIMVIAITGSTPGTIFQFEGAFHYEAQIPGMQVTSSHSDPTGLSAILASKSELQQTDAPEKDLATVVRGATRESNSMSKIGSLVGGLAGMALGNPSLGAALGNVGGSLLNDALTERATKIK